MNINQRKSVFAGILLCCWLVLGCEKEVVVPDLEGNIVGYLLTLDQFGNLLSDHSGVQVTIDGSGKKAVSDAGGRYEFSGVPAGTYDLTFNKNGFGTDKLTGVKHLGGKPTILGYDNNDQMYTWTRLYEIPTTQIIDIYPENDSLIAVFSFSVQPQSSSVAVIIFFSTQNNFSKSDAEVKTFNFWIDNGVYKTPLNQGDMPFEPGQTVYLKAMVFSSNLVSCITFSDNNTYKDCYTGKNIYLITGNESDQFSFVFPG